MSKDPYTEVMTLAEKFEGYVREAETPDELMVLIQVSASAADEFRMRVAEATYKLYKLAKK